VSDPAVCSHCGSPRQADEAFCEVCGLDFATGNLPAAPPPPAAAAAPVEGWVVVVEVDEDFFRSNESEGDTSLSPPAGQVAQELPLRNDEALIGRTSASANLHPDIDLSSDAGVSRRHAVLRLRNDAWTIADLGSTNGTRLDGELLPANEERVLTEASVVHVGAWTKLTVRRATSA